MGQPFNATEVARKDLAKRLYQERRIRDKFFDKLGAEPGWDMLLDLYVAQLEGRDTSVSNACISGCAPTTTATRWLSRMADAGQVKFWPHEHDRRVTYVGLTDVAIESLTHFLDMVGRRNGEMADRLR